MKILVCGGRDYSDRAQLFTVLDFIHENKPISLLIQGGARGADSLSKEWAISRGVDNVEFPADWAKYGKSAGPRRNQKMLEDGGPDFVLACPGGRGTENMVDLAKDTVRVWRLPINNINQ